MAANDSSMKRWWRLSGLECAEAIGSTIDSMRSATRARIDTYTLCQRLYANRNLIGPRLQTGRIPWMDSGPTVKINITGSIVDTLASKLSQSRPRALFLTNNGDWRQQRDAEKLTSISDGIFAENDTYAIGELVARDALVFGDGFIHHFERNNRAAMERVVPWEIYVDDFEALYGKPRQMHRVKYVDRDRLIEMFPKKKDAIKQVRDEAVMAYAGMQVSDIVEVRESWHLPSIKGAKDGAHVISVEGYLLTDVEEWTRDDFPFSHIQCSPPMTGFWGQGFPEQQQSMQLEVNRLCNQIQRSLHLGSTFKVLVEQGSKIVKEHINNDIGAIITYSGTGNKPEWVTPPLVQPEIYSHLMMLIQQMYQSSGVSQLSAASLKPAGLDSGKALREFQDIGTDRFRMLGHQYEKFYLDVAKQSLATARAIVEREGAYPVNTPKRNAIVRMDLKAIKLSEEEYVLDCYKVSSLPRDPAGRMQTVQEWVSAGWIAPEDAMDLLDFPDLDRANSLQTASMRYLKKILDEMVDSGDYTPPDADDNLVLARKLALQRLAEAKYTGVPESRQQLVRDFLTQIGDLEAAMAPPAPAAPLGLPPGGPAMPAPMPGAGMPPMPSA